MSQGKHIFSCSTPHAQGGRCGGVVSDQAGYGAEETAVIMVTTTDDLREVEHCHELGCCNYVTKPMVYEKFVDTIKQLRLFLMVMQVPKLNGTKQLK